MNKILYVVQARLESKRLPEKTLRYVGDKVLIDHILDRLFLSGATHEEIVFAIATEKDRRLQEALSKREIMFTEGDNYNVLDRYIQATKNLNKNDTVVRITADNPFLDYKILKSMVSNHVSRSADLAYPYKLPVGMGFEFIRAGALHDQLLFSLSPHHEEHVSAYIRENPEKYTIHQSIHFKNQPAVRMTIDYEEDLKQAEKTYLYFQQRNNPYFCSEDVYGLASQDSSFFSLNKNIMQQSPLVYEKR